MGDIEIVRHEPGKVGQVIEHWDTVQGRMGLSLDSLRKSVIK